MNREDNQSRFSLPLPGSVARYEKTGDKRDGPSFSRYNLAKYPLQLDMQATPASAWNKRCIRIFAEQYVRVNNAVSQDKEEVRRYFSVHFKALKLAYQDINKATLPPEHAHRLLKKKLQAKANSRIAEASTCSAFQPFATPLTAYVAPRWPTVE